MKESGVGSSRLLLARERIYALEERDWPVAASGGGRPNPQPPPEPAPSFIDHTPPLAELRRRLPVYSPSHSEYAATRRPRTSRTQSLSQQPALYTHTHTHTRVERVHCPGVKIKVPSSLAFAPSRRHPRSQREGMDLVRLRYVLSLSSRPPFAAVAVSLAPSHHQTPRRREPNADHILV